MILIKDDTTTIDFNKNYQFDDNYVITGSIDADLYVTSKMSKVTHSYHNVITNIPFNRYFTFTGDLTGLDEGNYNYTLKINVLSDTDNYEQGILQREIKLNPSESYSYATGSNSSDGVFVY